MRPSPITTTILTRLTKTSNVAIRLQRSQQRVRSQSIQLLQRAIHARLGLRVTTASRVITVTLSLGPSCIALIPRQHRRMAARNKLSVTKRISHVGKIISQLRKTKVPIDLFVSTSTTRVRTSTRVRTRFVRLRANPCTRARRRTSHSHRLTVLDRNATRTLTLKLQIGTNRNLAC